MSRLSHNKYQSHIDESERITVVIPTRDEPEILEACIISLINCSKKKDLLDVIILDNRSNNEKTFLAFERISAQIFMRDNCSR